MSTIQILILPMLWSCPLWPQSLPWHFRAPSSAAELQPPKKPSPPTTAWSSGVRTMTAGPGRSAGTSGTRNLPATRPCGLSTFLPSRSSFVRQQQVVLQCAPRSDLDTCPGGKLNPRPELLVVRAVLRGHSQSRPKEHNTWLIRRERRN